MSEEQVSSEAISEATSEEISEETSVDNTEESTEETTEQETEQPEESSGESPEETSEDGEKPAEKPSEKSSEPKKIKVKVYGKEQEYTLEELKQLASYSAGAEQKWKEAQSIQQKIEQAQEELKSDPVSALKRAGKSEDEIRQFMEDYLINIHKQELMSEEELRVYNLEQENKRLKAEQEKRDKEKQEKEQAAQRDSWAQRLEAEFTQALEQVNIPKNPNTIARMANYMEKALIEKIELSATQAAKLVEEDLKNEISHFYKDAPPDKLIQALGEDTVKKIKGYEASQVKDPRDGNKVAEIKPKKSSVSRKKKSWKELKSEWDKKFGEI